MSSAHYSNPDDGALRTALRASVEAPAADPTALLDLQDRILAQWSTQQAEQAASKAHSVVKTGGGMMAGLQVGSPHKQRQWQLSAGFVALALLLVVAFQATQTGREANMDDLLEPDVLALIAMGEL